MSRYRRKTDKEVNLARIEAAKGKYANKLKSVKGLYSEKEIYEIEFESQSYGTQIQKLRKSKGMTAQQLADQIGATAATVSKMEHGKIKTLRIEYLYLLCVIFETNPYYLLGKTDCSGPVVCREDNGHVKEGVAPIKFYEKEEIELSDILTEMTKIAEETYRQDKDLCEALVYILKHQNPIVRERLLMAITWICAYCIDEADLDQLKTGNSWLSRIQLRTTVPVPSSFLDGERKIDN